MAEPVTEAAALKIAREECRRRGWAWIEPINVDDLGTTYRIDTAADVLGGGSCSVVVDKDTAKISSAERYLR